MRIVVFMAHTTNPITATFEGFTVVYDGRTISECHATVDALHNQAHGLAPRFADDTADAGCTNYQDLKGAGPRQLRAYALIAQAHAWNTIAGILEEARDARPCPVEVVNGECEQHPRPQAPAAPQADPAHNGYAAIWECPCRECTALDYEVTDTDLSLAAYRAQQFPEHYGARP
jgi:hypothetical protein